MQESTIGAPPGMLVAQADASPPKIRVIAYNAENLVEREVTDIETLPKFLADWEVAWINVDGLGDVRTIERIGELMGLHRLALEDVLHGHQRAKAEDYHDHLFVVVRLVSLNERLDTEQLSLFLGKNFLLTFQEKAGDLLEPIRERLRKPSGVMQQSGAGYLAYAIVDAVVDSYFPVLEAIGERLESLEDEIIERPTHRIIGTIHDTKRDLLKLRRSVWPLRELVNSLIRDHASFFSEHTQMYLRDCYDHAIQAMDFVESDRDISSGLMEVYLSSVSNKMNEIMKVLTVIATVFIPLTFVTGVYGMNFNPEVSPWNMPELNWRFGYPVAWAVMLAVTLAMALFFRSRGWLGGDRERDKPD
jgi:magnesium transporter